MNSLSTTVTSSKPSSGKQKFFNYLTIIQLFRQHKIVLQHTWVYVVLASIAITGIVIDDRQLMGVSVWLKPLKFVISGIIYLLTVSYFATLYPFSQKKKTRLINLNAWVLLLDILIIFIQGARGVPSHYNVSSPIDGILFGTMGILITITVVIMVVFLIETARLKMHVSKPVQWSIFLGWLIVLAGSYAGGQMISQLSHTVGAADGGTGVAFTNWSKVAGDLRIAHFLGLHAIQIIPLFALITAKWWKTSTLNHILLVSLFALAFATVVFYTYHRAMQGLPLFY